MMGSVAASCGTPRCHGDNKSLSHRKQMCLVELPSRELTYPPKPKKWHFEDDFPFPQVGYVNSLEGIYIYIYIYTPPKDKIPNNGDVPSHRIDVSGVGMFYSTFNGFFMEHVGKYAIQ